MVLEGRLPPLFRHEPIRLVVMTILSRLVYRLRKLFRGASTEVVMTLRLLWAYI